MSYLSPAGKRVLNLPASLLIAWNSFEFFRLLNTISSLFRGCFVFISTIEPSIFASLGKFNTGVVCACVVSIRPLINRREIYFFIRYFLEILHKAKK